MGLIYLQVFLVFLNGIQFTVGQVTITTTPAVIESEITKSLVVTCRFPPQPSNGYQVFSLAVKKMAANSTFEQLASINRNTHSTAHIDATSYGISRSSGVIDSAQGSFLTLEWLNPNVSESGTYQCKANAFNQADDILVSNENKAVTFTQTSVGSLTNRLLELENEMNNKLLKLENDFNNLTADSTQTKNKFQELENDFKNLTDQSTQTENKLQKMENDFKNVTAQSTLTENKLQKLANDFNNLKAQTTQTENKLQVLDNDFKNLTDQSTQTENKLQKMENDFKNLTAQSTLTENKLQKLANDFNNLTAQTTQTENKLQKLENDIKNITAQSTQTENKLQKLETKLRDLQSTIFKTSAVANGRQYYLSLYEPNSAVNAEMACKALGGYLAEVDSKNEFDFLKTLIGMPSAHGISFLLGGTDEGHEGRWLNRRSGTPLGYTSWMQGNPDNNLFNGVRENCQAMVHFDSVYDFVMNDVTCFNSNAEVTKFYFICEVPV